MNMVITTISFLLTSAGSALAQQTSQPYYHHGHHMWSGGFGWFMGPFIMLVFIAIGVTLVIALARWFGRDDGNPSHQAHGNSARTPLEILQERFAKGEIEKEEFEERRNFLQS